MLKANSSIDSDFTSKITSQNNRRVLSEPHNSLRRVNILSFSILVMMSKQRLQVVSLQVPNLNSSIICNRRKDRTSVRRPANIIDLFFETFNLVANVLFFIFSVPHTHSPIVTTSQENGAMFFFPERRATHSVDGAGMTVVSL